MTPTATLSSPSRYHRPIDATLIVATPGRSPGLTASGPASPPPFRLGDDWWRRGVVYQVYPRSFADSDGDGVGDLPGIIDHLDHLGPDGLGGRRDLAVADLSVAGPRRRLRRQRPHRHRPAVRDRGGLRPARRRGPPPRDPGDPGPRPQPHQRRAPWFMDSPRRATRARRLVPVARPGRGRPRPAARCPPNNWVSWFGGPAWTYEPRRGQFYHHTFLAEQPDLDWRKPAVEKAQLDDGPGWLARGVDGFRLDVFNAYLKHPDLPVQPDADAGSDGVDPPGPPLRPRPARPARAASAGSGRSSTPSPAG